MATIKLDEAREWTILPQDTIITVKVLDEATEELDGKYGKWTKLNLTFEILDVPDEFKDAPDLVGSKIWGGVPFKFEDDPDNPLKNWAEAILGFSLDGNLGFELETADFVGRKCRAVIRNFEKRNGKVGHGVDALMPLGSGEMASPEGTASTLVGAQPTPAPAPAQQPTIDSDVPF